MTLKLTRPRTLACLFTALPLLVTGCNSTSGSASTADFTPDTNVVQSKDGWELVWNDEFDGEELNKANWQHEVNCWGGGNNEQQCYTKSKRNSYVSDGFLTIRALKRKTTGPAVTAEHDGYGTFNTSLPYSSARLRTKNRGDWKYGRFEIRAKLPKGQGTWPAIWMLPTDFVYGGWAASGEIDIMEAVNLHTTYKDSDAVNIVEAKSGESNENSNNEVTKVENRIHGTLHFGKAWPKNVSSGAPYDFGDPDINPADGFHTYTLEWEKDEMRWYVDDIHFATQTSDGWWAHYNDENGELQQAPDDAPFNQRFHLILNLAIGGSWAANVNEKGIDSSLKSAEMMVDYVRVYQCSNDAVSGKGCASNLKETAKFVHGVEEPPLHVAAVDLNAATLPLMRGPKLEESFHFTGWENDDNDTRKLTDEGLDIHLVGVGNAYLESLNGVLDMSNFEDGELMFDMQVMNLDADGISVKMDSGWPNVASVEIGKADLPPAGEWKSFRIKVSDFIAANPAFSIKKVLNPVVFDGVNSKEVHIKVKNIRFHK